MPPDTEVSATAEPVRANWSGNYTYRAQSLLQPDTVEALQALVRRLPRAKALGARHSFNHMADTDGTQLSLAGRRSMSLDRERRTVTVGAGVTYGQLAPWLHAQGFAVHNLASLPHISIAGACATGTHGSGVENGCLSTAVVGLELVDGDGNLRHLSREQDPDTFAGAVVGLGALGVVSSLTLAVVPAFDVAQIVYEGLSFEQLEHNLETIFGAGYSVSLFTDWQGHRATQVWLKRKLTPASSTALPVSFFTAFPGSFYGAQRQTAKLHPLPGLSAENCTEQQGIAGPWYERLPHFRNDYTPSSGAELQSEYFVALEDAYRAVLAVEELRDRITPLLWVSELRALAADELWMSMAHGRRSLAIHFTWKPELAAVLALLPLLEARLAPFRARPHWAKLFTMPSAELRQRYPRFDDFAALKGRFDPHRTFRNDYLDEIFGA